MPRISVNNWIKLLIAYFLFDWAFSGELAGCLVASSVNIRGLRFHLRKFPCRFYFLSCNKKPFLTCLSHLLPSSSRFGQPFQFFFIFANIIVDCIVVECFVYPFVFCSEPITEAGSYSFSPVFFPHPIWILVRLVVVVVALSDESFFIFSFLSNGSFCCSFRMLHQEPFYIDVLCFICFPESMLRYMQQWYPALFHYF